MIFLKAITCYVFLYLPVWVKSVGWVDYSNILFNSDIIDIKKISKMILLYPSRIKHLEKIYMRSVLY